MKAKGNSRKGAKLSVSKPPENNASNGANRLNRDIGVHFDLLYASSSRAQNGKFEVSYLNVFTFFWNMAKVFQQEAGNGVKVLVREGGMKEVIEFFHWRERVHYKSVFALLLNLGSGVGLVVLVGDFTDNFL